MLAVTSQRILFEFVIDFFYFPIWWYSKGLIRAFRKFWQLFLHGNDHLAPLLWLENLFVPMFGQYDWEGRIISFFMRLFQLFARSLVLMCWLLVCLFIFFLWPAFPLVVLAGFLSAFK